MERKIGEIFEYNGEWYQCVECDSCGECSLRTTECRNGTKSDIADEIFGECSKVRRPDNKHAIFKKVKKVGEPITIKDRTFQKLTSDNASCKECVFNIPNKACCKNDYVEGICDNGFWIEIKQTKEDMEENENNRTNCLGCGDNRFEVIARAKAHLLDATNITSDEKEMAVIDNILFRCYQMGWLKGYEQETPKPNLKPFDLEAAKEGKPVCTRDGRKARIICFDYKGDANAYPILALISTINLSGVPSEIIAKYTEDGRYAKYNNVENDEDLMMLPEKKEGWVNVYYDRIDGITLSKHPYPSKEEAIKNVGTMSNRIDTVKIFWEE